MLLITESGLLVQEIMHVMKRTRARRGWVGIKIDFEKAFDKIKSSFLLRILEKLGFHPIFIKWIFQCVGTRSFFFVLINRTPKSYFQAARALR